MSAGKVIAGIVVVVTVVGVGVLVATRKSDDAPRPSPGPSPGPTPRPSQEPTITPGQPPAPNQIPPEAEALPYAGHTIHIWEELDELLDFVAWKWITTDPSGLTFDSGSVTTPGLTGAAEARKKAENNVDQKFVP